MGQAVVHFEVIGKDARKLQGFYSDMFGWEINADNPMNYGLVQREGNTNADGVGIGGGIGSGQEGRELRHLLRRGRRRRGRPAKGREPRRIARRGARWTSWTRLTIGLFNDPEGHMIGLVKTPAGVGLGQRLGGRPRRNAAAAPLSNGQDGIIGP